MTARRYIIEFEQEPDKAEMEDLLALAGRLNAHVLPATPLENEGWEPLRLYTKPKPEDVSAFYVKESDIQPLQAFFSGEQDAEALCQMLSSGQ
jgi:hypothetical protein